MEIKINFSKGEKLDQLALAMEISKSIFESDYFDTELVIDGFLSVDKSTAKEDLEIGINFKILSSEKTKQSEGK